MDSAAFLVEISGLSHRRTRHSVRVGTLTSIAARRRRRKSDSQHAKERHAIADHDPILLGHACGAHMAGLLFRYSAQGYSASKRLKRFIMAT
jgi:hypothetical protein